MGAKELWQFLQGQGLPNMVKIKAKDSNQKCIKPKHSFTIARCSSYEDVTAWRAKPITYPTFFCFITGCDTQLVGCSWV